MIIGQPQLLISKEEKATKEYSQVSISITTIPIKNSTKKLIIFKVSSYLQNIIVIMSQSQERQRVQRNNLQAKYRYLADYSSQESPNLRKHYKKSTNQQLSDQRRSPSRKNSPQHSQHKRVSLLQPFSPSCISFRRQFPQQPFSPYNQRAQQQKARLYDELIQQNQVLRSQLVSSKQIIQSLKAELNRREVEVLQAKDKNQADLRYFQKVVAEITGQIQLVLTKNKILQNELLVVKVRLQEQIRRVQEFAKNQEDRKRVDRRKDSLGKLEAERMMIEQRRKEDFDREERKFKELTNKIMNQPRRSIGMLVTKSLQKSEALETSKIKMEDQLQSTRQHCENKRTENLPSQNQKQKQTKKQEQLIESILGMQLKIAGSQAGSLKDLWKWLKSLGHSQSCLKRWKPKAEAAISNGQGFKELLKEACSYIQ